MLPYRDADAALRDALLLSRAMSLKSAIADLELGGAWSVIIGDSGTDKTPALFEAYGRAIETFNGRFWAIVDVGTTASDLRHARTQSRYVTGLGGHPAAAGDPSPITAEGVLRSAALAVRRLHESSLSGVPVAIQGVGQVGASLAGKFKSAGARLVIADVDADVARRVADQTGAKIVSPELIAAQDVEGGVLYAPDYVANAGGIINIAGEIDASRRGKRFDAQWVSEKLDRLMKTLDDIFERSATENRPTDEIADDLGNTRLARRAPKGNGCG
jgi:leucine dehydrogenase